MQAGLERVNISLDGLNPKVLKDMSGRDVDPEQVLAGIQAAKAAGLIVKVNMVVKRGINESEILPLARRMHAERVSLRFIEYMDVGESNQWQRKDVVSGQQILDLLRSESVLNPVVSKPGETAIRYCYQDGIEVGFINSITQPFCQGCSRARISAEGKLYTCLFAENGHDVKAWLRNEKLNDTQIMDRLESIWHQRNDNYSEIRNQQHHKESHHPEMWTIGG